MGWKTWQLPPGCRVRIIHVCLRMNMLKQLTLNCDARIGRFLDIRHIAYTEETILNEGHGGYTREEWTKARRAGYNNTGPDARELDSDSSFLRRAFGMERRKLLSGLRLAEYLRKSSCRSVLEVGCGEMITSWAVKGCLPDIRYCATDYDEFVVEKCRKLALLDLLEKSTLDIDTVTTDFLGEFQLIVAWDVFYAFDTARLKRFLEKIKSARTSLMICSSQIIGPLRGLSYLIKSQLHDYAKQCRAGRIRDHGYKDSLGYYRQVALTLGLECRLIAVPPIESSAGDSCFFILISTKASESSEMPAWQPTA